MQNKKQVIAGNWKMNGTLSETEALINGLKEILLNKELTRTIIICPPFTSLQRAAELIIGTTFHLGAQNLHSDENGAYTGEISAAMLKEAGCEYVIIGHSERRTLFGEDDEFINKKVKKALATNLKPILCVGETLEEREKGITKEVVEIQLLGALNQINDKEIANIIIAYEPVWAIGTGRNATPEQANEVHEYIRQLLEEQYSSTIAEMTVIQYGGSVKPDNAASLLAMPHIDGALVGGASLNPESFAAIVTA